MQVAIHLGVHCTDDDRVLKTLLQNRDVLAKESISVPGPGRYRAALIKIIQKLKGAEADADTQEMMLDEIVDDDSTTRIVLTHENFICVPGRVFENSVLYDKAGYKSQWFRNAFSSQQVEFFLAIRNPASFIPAIFHHNAQNVKNFIDFLDGVDLHNIRWSDVILAIRESNPDSAITVWCNEDTPLIWPEVIREISGHDPNTKIDGGLDILNTIIKPEGMQRLQNYLDTTPPRNENQRRRILAAFLDKYAVEGAIEEELDVPGWTEELVDELSQIYEDDLYEIERMPGVNFITP